MNFSAELVVETLGPPKQHEYPGVTGPWNSIKYGSTYECRLCGVKDLISSEVESHVKESEHRAHAEKLASDHSRMREILKRSLLKSSVLGHTKIVDRCDG
jgi:hypothetical protein